MSTGWFEKICKLGGILHADFNKSAVSGWFEKIYKPGGDFYMQILVNLFLSFTFNIDLLSDKNF